MKSWDIGQIALGAQSRQIRPTSRPFTGRVGTDSRTVAAGSLFIALVGARHDAHTFLPDALAQNPAAILVHRELSYAESARAEQHDVAVLQTDDTTRGLNRLAAAYRQTLTARVIAIGGSNGKTTTKRILHSILSTRFRGHASPKSFNNNIGMPLTLLEVESDHDYVVLEIGTNAPGEIAALGAVCRPDDAAITSIGREHLEQLGDVAGVAREEAAIAAFVRPGGLLIVPENQPQLAAALAGSGVRKLTIGPAASGANLMATDIRTSASGSTFSINSSGSFSLPLLGRHNVHNALCAVALARHMGMSDAQIAAGLAMVKPAPLRLEMRRVGPHRVLLDAYNANPDSMIAALETLAELDLPAGHKRVAVLGDMLELGAASGALHQEIGQHSARCSLDLLVAIGPAMARAAEMAQRQGVRCVHFSDTPAAAEGITGLLGEPALILIKGSRGMALERVLASLDKDAASVGACH